MSATPAVGRLQQAWYCLRYRWWSWEYQQARVSRRIRLALRIGPS